MLLQQLTAKLFASDGADVQLDRLIPVFQRWIRDGVFADHLLIDVADYSHVHDGPGLILIAHEAHLGIERVGGKLGLRYSRKRDQPGPSADKLAEVVVHLLTAAHLLEREPELGLRFSAHRLELGVLSRLVASEDDASYARFEGALSQFLPEVYGGHRCEISKSQERGPVTLDVRAETETSVRDLLWRLGAAPEPHARRLQVVL
jgi:hypothetical protein